MCDNSTQIKKKEKKIDSIFQKIKEKTDKDSDDFTSDDISEILKAVCNCPVGILP